MIPCHYYISAWILKKKHINPINQTRVNSANRWVKNYDECKNRALFTNFAYWMRMKPKNTQSYVGNFFFFNLTRVDDSLVNPNRWFSKETCYKRNLEASIADLSFWKCKLLGYHNWQSCFTALNNWPATRIQSAPMWCSVLLSNNYFVVTRKYGIFLYDLFITVERNLDTFCISEIILTTL